MAEPKLKDVTALRYFSRLPTPLVSRLCHPVRMIGHGIPDNDRPIESLELQLPRQGSHEAPVDFVTNADK